MNFGLEGQKNSDICEGTTMGLRGGGGGGELKSLEKAPPAPPSLGETLQIEVRRVKITELHVFAAIASLQVAGENCIIMTSYSMSTQVTEGICSGLR